MVVTVIAIIVFLALGLTFMYNEFKLGEYENKRKEQEIEDEYFNNLPK